MPGGRGECILVEMCIYHAKTILRIHFDNNSNIQNPTQGENYNNIVLLSICGLRLLNRTD